MLSHASRFKMFREVTLHCIVEIRAHWVETKNLLTSITLDIITRLLDNAPLSVFTWWEDFLKISRKCAGREVEGFSFRLNG